MARIAKEPPPRRNRLAVDVPASLRRRVRVAAAERDLTMQAYVRRALERQLADDSKAAALRAADDPVLAELWSSSEDAAYDDL